MNAVNMFRLYGEEPVTLVNYLRARIYFLIASRNPVRRHWSVYLAAVGMLVGGTYLALLFVKRDGAETQWPLLIVVLSVLGLWVFSEYWLDRMAAKFREPSAKNQAGLKLCILCLAKFRLERARVHRVDSRKNILQLIAERNFCGYTHTENVHFGMEVLERVIAA